MDPPHKTRFKVRLILDFSVFHKPKPPDTLCPAQIGPHYSEGVTDEAPSFWAGPLFELTPATAME